MLGRRTNTREGASPVGGPSSTHRLFLRWACGVSAALLAVSGLVAAGFASGVHGAPAVAIGVMLAITVGLSALAGRLYWRADMLAAGARVSRAARTRSILHSAEHIYQAVVVLQVLGLLGAMLGYRQETSASGSLDAGAAIHQANSGLVNGLTATIAGVLMSLLLFAQYHFLRQALERPRHEATP